MEQTLTLRPGGPSWLVLANNSLPHRKLKRKRKICTLLKASREDQDLGGKKEIKLSLW
jgi:hypothetical protein